MSIFNLKDIQLREHQPDVVVMDSQYLSIPMLDSLSDQCHDWIGLLQPRQEIELCSLSLLGVKKPLPQKNGSLTISDIVELTLQVPYQEISVFQNRYWSYTCCLHVFGLGRIRFVVCFDNSNKAGAFQAFITNRLDWSATRVAESFLQYHSASPLYCQSTQRSYKRNPCMALVAQP